MSLMLRQLIKRLLYSKNAQHWKLVRKSILQREVIMSIVRLATHFAVTIIARLNKMEPKAMKKRTPNVMQLGWDSALVYLYKSFTTAQQNQCYFDNSAQAVAGNDIASD